MTLHAVTLSDVLLHSALGVVFVCGNGCVRHFCKHRMIKYALAALLILVEATVMVAVVG